MDLNPVMGNIAPGGSASASIAVRPSSATVGAVNLSVGTTAEGGGLPAGLNVSMNPPVGVPPFVSAMNISTSSELAPGVHCFLVTAVGPDMTQMATYTLIVRSGQPTTKKHEVGQEQVGEE